MPQNIFKIYDGRNKLWQWDKGQKIIVGKEEITELQFSNKAMPKAVKADVYREQGQYVCDIPDEILEMPHDLVVYACIVNKDYSKTVYCSKLPVATKPMPTDWIDDSELLPSDWFATIKYVDRKIDDIQISGGGITVREVQEMIDEVGQKIGDIKEGKTVVEMITDAVYDDTVLAGRVTANENAITTLNGEGDGSVKKLVDDALNDFAAENNSDMTTLTDKVSALETTVGKAAEGETAASGLVKDVADLETRVGDTSVSDQIDEALLNSQADWDQTDSTKPDYIKNKPDENDALELVSEMGLAEPVSAEDGSVYTDENGVLYTL